MPKVWILKSVELEANLIISTFYYSPRQNAWSRRNSYHRLQASIDFVMTKYPNLGIFIAGDANEPSRMCKDQKLKQIVDFPTTKGGTSLDVISTNLKTFYNTSTTPRSVVAIISC